MSDVLQIVLLALILFWMIGLKRSFDAATPRTSQGDLGKIMSRLDAIQDAVAEIQDHVGEIQQDHEILDELEANVMREWEKVIEEELGKRPIAVPCPACNFEGGLEPNLLADEDLEYGCPSCGLIFARDALREKYPNADI